MRRTVDGDTNEIAKLLELATGELQGPEVPEDKVVVRARSLELVALGDELLAEGLRVGDDLLGVGLPRRLGRLQQSGGNAGDGVVVRAALARGEDGVVDALLEVGSLLRVLAEEDEAGAGTAEGLVPERESVQMRA